MRRLIPWLRVAFLLVLVATPAAVPAATATAPLTRPEASRYEATSSLQDVMDFLRQLQSQSPYLRIENLVVTAEGRQVPLVIAGNPLPQSAAEARRDSRPVIYIQGDIHAGEVSGKEALQMILRDMTVGDRQDLLSKAIYLFVPIFNADGNEPMSPENRSYLQNPAQGVGRRYTSQNYDLNRDYVKTESREVRSVLKRVIIPWDPLVYVDLHDTDGSFHQETVTYLSPRSPNWDAGISGYIWDTLYPAIDKKLRQRGIMTLPYGNFIDRMAPEKGWATFAPTPAIGEDYMGLRNRFSILVEIYAYASYQTRIEHCYEFLTDLLPFVTEHVDTMEKLVIKADRDAANNALLPPDQRKPFCLDVERDAFATPLTIEGFEYEPITDSQGRARVKPLLDKKKTYTVPYFGKFVCTRSRPTPWAYFLPPGCDSVVRELRRHGIRVEKLLQTADLSTDRFTPTSLKVEPWVTQGHSRLTVEGDWKPEPLHADAGWFFIPMNQPLAALIASLMEPDYSDSLVSWNFFNIWVTHQWSHQLPPLPIYRQMTATPLFTREVTNLDLAY